MSANLNRRSFLTGAAGTTALAAAGTIGLAGTAAAQAPATEGEVNAAVQWLPPYPGWQAGLRRLTFGPSPDWPELRSKQEYLHWVQDQLLFDPSEPTELEDLIAAELPTTQMPIPDVVRDYRTNHGVPIRELINATMVRRIYSQGQIYELMVQFWQKYHFSFPSEFFGYVSRIAAGQHDRAIRPYALGTFADLLVSVVRRPPLLIYLNNHQSRVGHINENFGRELLELYTLGGDANNDDPAYSEEDVKRVARLMTGWRSFWADGRWSGEFQFQPNWHDTERLPIFEGGTDQECPVGHTHDHLWERPDNDDYEGHGEAFLRHLALHPRTADHICRKLAFYFMGDRYTEALIEDMKEAWCIFGSHIPTVLKGLFQHPDFIASLEDGWRPSDGSDPAAAAPGLLRLPLDHFVFCARSVGGNPRPDQFNGTHWNELFDTRHLDFRWGPPNGYPLHRAYWLTPSGVSNRFYQAAAVAMNRNPLCWWQPSQLLDRVETRFGPDVNPAIGLAQIFLAQEPHPRLLTELETLVADRTLTELRDDPTTVRRVGVLCFNHPQANRR